MPYFFYEKSCRNTHKKTRVNTQDITIISLKRVYDISNLMIHVDYN
jgi:hypothetical protein